MNKILFRLVISQFKLFFREPGVVFWSFGFPVLMAWILGIAFANKDMIVRNVAVVAEKPEAISMVQEWLLKKTEAAYEKHSEKIGLEWKVGQNNGEQAHFRFSVMSEDAAILALKRGQIALLIEGSPETDLRYRFDPKNSEARLTYLLLESAFREQESIKRKTEILPLSTIGIRYVDFLIPGLMAISIMNACLWGIGWNLIELRIKKLMRRMVATPLKKSVLLLSHGLNRMVLSAAELILLYLFARFYFGIIIQGSLTAMALVFLSGYSAFAGIAVLISSRVENTQSGNGLINSVTLPMFILSGIFFSYQNFPDWLIPYVEVLPLTMLTNSLRGIMTEGIGLTQVIQPAMGLIGIGSVCFALGLRLYRWH